MDINKTICALEDDLNSDSLSPSRKISLALEALKLLKTQLNEGHKKDHGIMSIDIPHGISMVSVNYSFDYPDGSRTEESLHFGVR